MSLTRGRIHLPATLEFLARCALAARRRFGSAGGGVVDPRPAPPSDPPEPAALAQALDRLGVHPGDVLMVHSSGAAIERWGWELPDFIDTLLEYLGPSGTLAMPCHPRLSTHDGRELYDVRRSASTVGLMTELFRRRKGALRSRFPLSSASAQGAHADALISGHRRSFAPHDEHSPYARLADLRGKVLCIGCPLDRMTILHVAEDVLRAELPVAGFHETREVWMRDQGEEQMMTVHARSGWLWWYLALSRWTYDMYRNDLARDHELAGVTLRAADAHGTVEWMKAELRAGRWIYPLARANRWLSLAAPPQENES